MIVYIAAAFLVLGAIMYTRGWIYTIWPDSKIAEKRKRRNLKVGFPTDMKLFGRKVRRVGFMILIVGGGMLGWHFTSESAPPAPAENAPAAATP